MRTFQTTKPQQKFLFVEATELQNTSEKSPTTFSEHFSWELIFFRIKSYCQNCPEREVWTFWSGLKYFKNHSFSVLCTTSCLSFKELKEESHIPQVQSDSAKSFN